MSEDMHMKHQRSNRIRKYPTRRSLCLALLAATIGLASPAFSQTNDASRQFTTVEGDLANALDQVASQSGLQIIYSADLVRGKRAAALDERLTWQEALRALLSGTGLSWGVINGNTIVIKQVKAQTPDPGRNETIVPADAERNRSSNDGPTDELATIVVTGSRIPRSKSEFDVAPVTIFDQAQIERSGATNIADFLGRISQNEHNVLSREQNGEIQSGKPRINLRGLGTAATLVLLNGRRMPQTGRGTSRFGAPDDGVNLANIPLSAVQRIEVLTDSASAVYGSDAIGGVVNIITRKDYYGLEMSAQVGQSERGDAGERQFGAAWGKSGATSQERQYSLSVNAESYDFDGLMARDRPFTSSSDYSESGGQPLRPAVPFTPNAGAGSVAAIGPFPLPGLGANFVAIPEGQDGRSLTAADFDESAPITSANVDRSRFRTIMPNEERQSVSISGEIEFETNLIWFADASVSRNKSYTEDLPPTAVMRVPASNPFNPFGVEVVVSKVFYELGPSWRDITSEASTFASGLKGKWNNEWQYEFTASYARTAEDLLTLPGTLLLDPYPLDPYDFDSPTVTPIGYYLLNETDPSRALNVFGDGRTTSPNAQTIVRQLLTTQRYSEVSENATISYNTDGRLFVLPSGPVRASLGAEFRRQALDIRQQHDRGVYMNSIESRFTQDFAAAYGEALVPLLGSKPEGEESQRLSLTLAGRADYDSEYQDVVLTPRVGLLWQPSKSLAVRSSYSRGYKTPGLQQMYSRPFSVWRFVNIVDPVTGSNVGLVQVTEGGNPDLEPEKSESWNLGLVYRPEWLKGGSLSIDWYDIDYVNRVVGPGVNPDVLVLFNPERLTRDPATNAITAIDARSLNIGASRVRGVDVRVRHRFQAENYGYFDTNVNATYNIDNKEVAPSGVEVIDLVDLTVPRMRANASLFWGRGDVEIGGTVSYVSSIKNINFLNGGYSPRRVDASYNLDIQASVDLRALFRGRKWSDGWRLTFGVNNVFDTSPSATDGDGGYANLDPRMRRFYVGIKKAL